MSNSILTPGRFTELKARIKSEVSRRRYVGSVTSYASTSYDYTITPKALEIPRPEHINKILEPIRAINPTSMPELAKNGTPIQDNFDLMDSTITVFVSKPLTAAASNTGCAASCTGLCSTSCTSCTGCSNACTSCTGSCDGCRGCGGACSYSCSGGCDGCRGCGGACSYSCSGCSGGCTGCTNECTANCGNTCSTGCYGCSVTCSGNCSYDSGGSGCGGGCTYSCTYSCAAACEGCYATSG